MEDFEQDLRNSLKLDKPNFNLDENFKAVLQKLEQNEKEKRIIPKDNRFQFNYWLIAAAMSALMISFGIERQMDYQSNYPSSVYAQDSILDSSTVDLDSTLMIWK